MRKWETRKKSQNSFSVIRIGRRKCPFITFPIQVVVLSGNGYASPPVALLVTHCRHQNRKHNRSRSNPLRSGGMRARAETRVQTRQNESSHPKVLPMYLRSAAICRVFELAVQQILDAVVPRISILGGNVRDRTAERLGVVMV